MMVDGIQGMDYCVKRHVNSLMVSQTKKYLEELIVAKMEKIKITFTIVYSLVRPVNYR